MAKAKVLTCAWEVVPIKSTALEIDYLTARTNYLWLTATF